MDLFDHVLCIIEELADVVILKDNYVLLTKSVFPRISCILTDSARRAFFSCNKRQIM